jgi:hypothetical protein
MNKLKKLTTIAMVADLSSILILTILNSLFGKKMN